MPELIECQVCLTELQESNNTILHFKCCLQSSHKECFLKWLSYRGINVTCPVCRSDIISNNLIKSLISTNDILDYIKIDKSNEKRLQDVLRQVYKLPIKEPYFNDTMYTMFLKFLFVFSIAVFIISLILLINIVSGKVN
jgi:hypothetical protein